MKRNSIPDESSLSKKVNFVECNPIVSGLSVNSVNSFKKSATDLVQLAAEIQKADSFVRANACNKLQVIAQQIKFLQNQAQDILAEAKTNADLHHVACNFVKVPGNIYHLYQRPSGQQYFGMLSPLEWSSCLHEYLGGYRLEIDHSWTPVDKLHNKDCEIVLLNKILTASNEINVSKSLQDAPMDL